MNYDIEQLLEAFIQAGVKAYKKLYGEGRKLFRHEPVLIKGVEFSCWRELSVYMMGKYLEEILEDSKIEVELDGNNSILRLEMSEETENKLTFLILAFFTEQKLNPSDFIKDFN